MSITAIRSIDPSTYVAHALHRNERAWVESNCYIDVWLEILHALELEPLACAAFTFALDFEGDQWTFYKPPHMELTRLYGIDVEELNVYRPLIDHLEEHLPQRKLILAEVDSYYLPDTAATDYRQNHVKTTIAAQELDRENKRLGYFHNAGYYVLEGADFVGLFGLDAPRDPKALPLFAELVRLKRARALPTQELVAHSLELLGVHLKRRPEDNPVARFAARFPRELERLREEGLGAYHAYAFASSRQLGSAFELAGAYLRWLGQNGVDGLDESAAHCDTISTTAKSLILKGARAVNARRPADVAPMMDAMASAWDGIMGALAPRFGGERGAD